MLKLLLLPFLFVVGCGAGVTEMTAGRPSADGDAENEIFSEGAETEDTATSAPEVRIETSGGGSVFESVASSERYRQWLAIPAPGWVFDRWELVGSTFREDGTEVIYRGGFFGDNPLELDSKSDGVLTAVFVEDVPEPEILPPVDLVNSVAVLQDSTWLVLAVSDDSALIATAFAISETRLATNAHVVEGIKDILREPNAHVGLFQHETGLEREIVRVWTHPTYDADGLQPTPDLGIMSTAEAMPTFVVTPALHATPSIDVLERVMLCGFPGSVTIQIDLLGAFISGQFHPRASCLSGNVSALRPFDAGQSLTQANGRLIQYDISTEPGLSGSAVFNEQGEVIGVHALGFSNDAEQNFAIRSDVLAEMLAWIDRDSLSSVLLSDIQPQLDPDPPADESLCDSTCDFCLFGTATEGQCPSHWDGDGVCDCGCQFIDMDCVDRPLLGSLAHLAVLGVPTGYGCGSVCVQFPESGNIFCDSDCDGWFDHIEIEFGYDPCNELSPPFPPSTPAQVCTWVFGPATAKVHTFKEFQKARDGQVRQMKR